MSTRELILYLKGRGHTIASICEYTGESVTFICEVIYEQNNIDKHTSGI